MDTAHTTLDEVQDFLAQRRLALVGLSRQESAFSRGLFKELRGRGYDVVPVNPALEEVEGQRCYARVQEVLPRVDWALVMTAAAQSEQVVRDCIEAGVGRVWLHRGAGEGAVSAAAVELCLRSGVRVVAGECPYMFLPQTEWFHRAHGGWRKLMGTYPAARSAASL